MVLPVPQLVYGLTVAGSPTTQDAVDAFMVQLSDDGTLYVMTSLLLYLDKYIPLSYQLKCYSLIYGRMISRWALELVH